ncbi:hypothetical protein DJ94_4508 [Bacillus pseudomycoides]|nr:hypothetical protein DJ94_4508 [Bacillus pseudomycoides]
MDLQGSNFVKTKLLPTLVRYQRLLQSDMLMSQPCVFFLPDLRNLFLYKGTKSPYTLISSLILQFYRIPNIVRCYSTIQSAK